MKLPSDLPEMLIYERDGPEIAIRINSSASDKRTHDPKKRGTLLQQFFSPEDYTLFHRALVFVGEEERGLFLKVASNVDDLYANSLNAIILPFASAAPDRQMYVVRLHVPDTEDRIRDPGAFALTILGFRFFEADGTQLPLPDPFVQD